MRTVTLVLHGTFAANETWWRLGDGEPPTFADRLESALSARGLPGTVWKPALEAGLTYESFSWSGRNLHRERVAGGARIAGALRDLASREGATAADPLTVNLVAHSHGGNVALEALARLPASVRVGGIAFLGTPLIRSRPTFRVARLFVIAGLMALSAIAVVGLLVFLLFSDDKSAPALLAWLGGALVYVTAAGWLARLVAGGLDLGARAFWWPLRAARGSQAYGPKAKALDGILDGRPVVLFTSHQDEADVLLQLSVAPTRVYLESVRRWGRFRRLAEFVFLRPFVLGVASKVVEVLLERGALGFTFWKLLWNDYEMEDLDRRRAYPRELFERHDVTPVLAATLRAEAEHEMRLLPDPAQNLQGMERHAHNFRQTLEEVLRNLREQVRLRHSAYYKSDEIVERVAETFSPAR